MFPVSGAIFHRNRWVRPCPVNFPGFSRRTFQMKKNLLSPVRVLVAVIVCFFAGAAPLRAFMRPHVIFTVEELEAVKAKVEAGEEPWKSGYEMLAADWHSSLDYKPRGAVAVVSRNPHANLPQWRTDMTAAYNQARMWYFTRNKKHAEIARDILLDWAETQTSFDGMEANLDLGDFAFRFVGAADILRSTWPGWKRSDTDKVKALFGKVYWPRLGMDGLVLGPTNKGSLGLAAATAIAVFCEDQEKLNRVLHHIRNTPSTGILNSIPSGQHGETGRDQGHSYGHMLAMSFCARVLWNQGIDLFSFMDNRLLALGEYYARYNLGVETPFVPLGTTDEYYTSNWGEPGFVAEPSAYSILHSAYVVRKGMSAPYLSLKLAAQPLNMDAFMYLKTGDKSTARPLPEVRRPSHSPIGAGFEDKDIGDASPAGGSSYANGVWTVKGSGSEIWTHGADSFHFTYKRVTGDCSIIARVESAGNSHPKAKTGLMIRSDLKDTADAKLWVALLPLQPEPNDKLSIVETYMHGWTNVYGGSNWEMQSYWVPQLPYWLKIERLGHLITAYASRDGTSWTPLVYGEYRDMPATAYLGLAVCANSNGSLNTSTFSNVNITGGTAGKVEIPPAPEALLASPGDGRVPLRWLASFGATGYTVKRAEKREGPYKDVATGVTGTSYVDERVSNNTTYHYVVTATNEAGASPDSPVESVTPLPGMKHLIGGGTASASHNNDSPSEGVARAFDLNSGSKWFNGNAGPGGWIQYDFGPGETRVVKRYDIISAGDVPGRDPKDWQLFGSNDGEKWSLLDERENETFPYRFFPKSHPILNDTGYRFYRLHISANGGDVTGLQLAELRLMGR